MTNKTIDHKRFGAEILAHLDRQIQLGEQARSLRDLLTGRKRGPGDGVELYQIGGQIAGGRGAMPKPLDVEPAFPEDY